MARFSLLSPPVEFNVQRTVHSAITLQIGKILDNSLSDTKEDYTISTGPSLDVATCQLQFTWSCSCRNLLTFSLKPTGSSVAPVSAKIHVPLSHSCFAACVIPRIPSVIVSVLTNTCGSVSPGFHQQSLPQFLTHSPSHSPLFALVENTCLLDVQFRHSCRIGQKLYS